MTRKSKIIITAVSREDAEQSFSEYAKAAAKIKKINAEMDLKFAKIREKEQVELANLTEVKNQQFEVINAFAMENESLFLKRKSLEMAQGVIGFRTGKPKLKLAKGFQWVGVVSLLKAHSVFKNYVKTVDEIEKAAIISHREVEEIANQLHQVGLKIEQEERFYIEPKKEVEVEV